MANVPSLEKAPSLPQKETSDVLRVTQPAKMEVIGNILSVLDTIESVPQKVSEMTGEDRSNDMGGGGMATRSQQSQMSPRDQAIAAMPAEAPVLREKLKEHIEDEIKLLRKAAHHHKKTSAPGGAYKLNELYARIRKLNTLLSSLVEASMDVLRKFYIRVFVDRQAIL
jgi:hypothetical protein